jgi:hypothetical protein
MFVINWFLMMVFFACGVSGDYTRYDEMKASGQWPCYGYIETPWDPTPGPGPNSPPPVCFYDPKAY